MQVLFYYCMFHGTMSVLSIVKCFLTKILFWATMNTFFIQLVEQEVKYTKRILKMGDQTNYPKKGDDVACFYTGKLQNGKVFDTNMENTGKLTTRLNCSTECWSTNERVPNSAMARFGLLDLCVVSL